MGLHWQVTFDILQEEMIFMEFDPDPGFGYRFYSIILRK